MILGFHRRQVIANIKRNVAKKQFNSKAELHDPVLDQEQTNNIVNKYWKYTSSIGYRMINPIIRGIFAAASQILTGRCQIE
ncbi:MAG: 1-acyl-sn-glycerol-3-phosphate acyltransferase, partial [Lactobacillus amylovorus]|nr:1-acyl-sn-glycerol-3-phosphate acyltransferase [Lactobacillus amylovorus]